MRALPTPTPALVFDVAALDTAAELRPWERMLEVAAASPNDDVVELADVKGRLRTPAIHRARSWS